jgi:hypothetical protein
MEGSNLPGDRIEEDRKCCKAFMSTSGEDFSSKAKFEQTKRELSLICGCKDCKNYSYVVGVAHNALVDAGVEEVKGLLLGGFAE